MARDGTMVCLNLTYTISEDLDFTAFEMCVNFAIVVVFLLIAIAGPLLPNRMYRLFHYRVNIPDPIFFLPTISNMSNIILSKCESPLNFDVLGIEHNENDLVYWLQTKGRETVSAPICLYIVAS